MSDSMIGALARALRRAGWSDRPAPSHAADLVLVWGSERPPRFMLAARSGAVTLIEPEGLMTRWEQITPDNLGRVQHYLETTIGES